MTDYDHEHYNLNSPQTQGAPDILQFLSQQQFLTLQCCIGSAKTLFILNNFIDSGQNCKLSACKQKRGGAGGGGMGLNKTPEMKDEIHFAVEGVVPLLGGMGLCWAPSAATT